MFPKPSWLPALLALAACPLPSATPGTIACTVPGAPCPDGLACVANLCGGSSSTSVSSGSTAAGGATSTGSSGTTSRTTGAPTSASTGTTSTGTTSTGTTSTGTTSAGTTSAGTTTTGTTSAGTTSAGTTSAGTTSAGTTSLGTTSAGTTSAGTTSAGTTSTGSTSAGSTGTGTGATSTSTSTSTSGTTGSPCGAPFCVSTLAGNGQAGDFDGTGGPNGTTIFNEPNGVAVDGATGNVYVADFHNNAIRLIAPGGQTTTLTGNGTAGFFDGTGGALGTTEFSSPKDLGVFGGQVYVGDWGNNRVRLVAASGATTTLAGNGTAAYADGTGGPTGTAKLNAPYGVVVDSQGNAYACDDYDSHIRKIAPDGTTTTFAGSNIGWLDGPGPSADFHEPRGLAIDSAGNLYVADWQNNRIRQIAPDGTTSTLAGNGTAGFQDGTGGPTGTAEFNGPDGVAVDNAGFVYVADSSNNRIRRIALDGGAVTTIAGNGNAGFIDGAGGIAEFSLPTGIAVDSLGNLYVADRNNHRVRVITGL